MARDNRDTGTRHAALRMPRPRTAVILDTDIGDDIDDTWALAMLLGCHEVEVKLIVTATDDTPAKTRLVAKILERLGRPDIPIGTGVKTGDRPLAQRRWLGDYDLPKYSGVVREDGVGAAIETIVASSVPVTILAIGPQTNLAEALRREPRIARNARVVAMAGSVDRGYCGKSGADAEYNVKRDVAAARAVLAAPWEVAMTPLDGCGDVVLKGERFARVRSSGSARAMVVMENYELWDNRAKHPADASSILYDTVASYMAFDDAYCVMAEVALSVDDEGRTVRDGRGRRVRCHMGWRDRDAFEELVVSALTVDTQGDKGAATSERGSGA